MCGTSAGFEVEAELHSAVISSPLPFFFLLIPVLFEVWATVVLAPKPEFERPSHMVDIAPSFIFEEGPLVGVANEGFALVFKATQLFLQKLGSIL